jgi:DNA-binding SARP family transcriptional activator
MLSVLGPLRLFSDDGDVNVGGAVTRRFLIRLVLAGGAPVSSAELMEAVWAEPRDGGLLRVQVSRLRRIVEPSGLQIATGPYGWSIDRSSYIDSRDVLEERVAALRKQTNPHLVIAQCASALALWTGHSLADVPDAIWAEAESSRLDRIRDSLRTRRAEALVASGALGEGLAEFVSISNERPLDERSTAWGAACLADLGRSGEGLELLTSLRDRLREEIGFSPGELPQLTERLILDGRERVCDQLPRIAPLDEVSERRRTPRNDTESSSRLIGREREWSELLSPDRPNPRVTLVAGDEGSGKSTLIAAHARVRARQGAIVLHGSFRLGSQVPHQGIVDALAAGAGDPRVETAVGELPVLDALRSYSVRTLEDERPERIGIATAHLLRSVADHTDVLFILDDAHWAPESSLLAIDRLIRSLPFAASHSIEVILATRDTGEHREAADNLIAIVKGIPSTVLTLAPFGPGDVALMMRIRGSEPNEGEVARVMALTAGNPFLVNECVASPSRDVLLAEHNGVDRMLRSVLPTPLQRALGRRIAALSTLARDVIRLVVSYRSPLPLNLLIAALPPVDRHRVHDSIDEAVNAGVIVEDTATGSLQVRHGLYEFAITETMTIIERQTLHRRIADVLLVDSSTAGIAVSPAFIAEQLEAAGPLASGEELARWLVRAADHARTAGAFEAARVSAERAVAVIEATGRPDEELLAALAVRQRVAAHGSEILLSKAMGSRIIRLALPTGAFDAAANALALHCTFGRDIREDPDSLTLADLVIEKAPEGSPAVARALAAKALHSSLWLGNAAIGRMLARRARDVAEASGDDTACAESAWALGMSSLATAELDELDEAIVELRRRGLTSGRGGDAIRSWRLLAFASLQRGDVSSLEWAIDELEGRSREPQQWLSLTDVARWRSTLAHLRGDFAEAEAQRMLQAERGFGLAPFLGSALAQDGLQRFSRDDLETDHPMFAVVASNRTALLSLDALRANLDLRAGVGFDVPARIQHLVHQLGPDELNRNRLCDFVTLTSLCEVAHDLGHDVRVPVEDLRQWMDPYRQSFAFAGVGEHVFGSMERFVAIARSIVNDTAAADLAFANATSAESSRGWTWAASETAAAHQRHRLRHRQLAG